MALKLGLTNPGRPQPGETLDHSDFEVCEIVLGTRSCVRLHYGGDLLLKDEVKMNSP